MVEPLDTSTLSTGEIRRLREEEIDLDIEEGPICDENCVQEIDDMTPKEVQDFLITTSKSLDMMHSKLLKLKSIHNVEKGYMQILQIHGYIKFNDQKLLRTVLKESMTQNNASFINRIVKYAAQFCYAQSEYPPIMQWSNMMTGRTEYEWQRAFNNAALASPEMEVQLYSALIMLIPNPSPKAASRVFNIFAKQDQLPPCFEFLAKRAFQFVSASAFHKADMEPVARMYLSDVFKICLKWKLQNRRTAGASETAQTMFTSRTLGIANKAFGIVQSSDDNAAEKLIENPLYSVKNPSSLFVEYMLQYIKLGLFRFDKGDKLIAWNYYYDDRWCGYDRMDLFGDKETFKLTETFKWCSDFKYAGVINQHPHHESLILASKVYEWMSADPELYDRLMEKYESEDLIQHFAISLSFAGFFKSMINLFEKYKNRMQTVPGYLCLHLCYMYSCAKEGMAQEGLMAWINVMETAVKNHLLGSLKFPPDSFPLPSFVEMRHVGQFACRLLRNCLWTSCIKNGTDSWKKYAMIILHLCDALEDSFLNHNMIRIMFQKISLDDMPLLVRPVLAKCLRHHHAFWDCLNIAKSRGYEVPEDIMQLKLIPSPTDEYKQKPGFLMVYKKLKKLDEIFYDVVMDLSKKVFKDTREEILPFINHLSSDQQEKIKEIVEYQKEKAKKQLEEKLKKKKKESRLKRKLKKAYGETPVKKSKRDKKDLNESGLTEADDSIEFQQNLPAPAEPIPVDENYDEIDIDAYFNSNENPFVSLVSYEEADLAFKTRMEAIRAAEEAAKAKAEQNGDATDPAAIIPSTEIKEEPMEADESSVVVENQDVDEMEETEQPPVLVAEEPIPESTEEPSEQADGPSEQADGPSELADEASEQANGQSEQAEDQEKPVLDIPEADLDDVHVLEHKEGEDESLPVNANFVEASESTLGDENDITVGPEVPEEPMEVDEKLEEIVKEEEVQKVDSQEEKEEKEEM